MFHSSRRPQSSPKIRRQNGAFSIARDLFVLGAPAGVRLKDGAVLEWKSVGKAFIEITLRKTSRVNAFETPF